MGFPKYNGLTDFIILHSSTMFNIEYLEFVLSAEGENFLCWIHNSRVSSNGKFHGSRGVTCVHNNYGRVRSLLLTNTNIFIRLHRSVRKRNRLWTNPQTIKLIKEKKSMVSTVIPFFIILFIYFLFVLITCSNS